MMDTAPFPALRDFVDLLRAEGMAITSKEHADLIVALEDLGVDDPEIARLTMRSLVARDHATQCLFDTLFDRFFLGRVADEEKVPTDSGGASDDGGAESSDEQGMQAAAGEVHQSAHIVEEWRHFDRDLSMAMRSLKRLLRHQTGRRWQTGRKGPRLDLNRTLANARKRGGELLMLARKRPKLLKTQAICLVDVSNSMSTHTRYLVQFVLALHRVLPRCHTIFFSDQSRDLTRYIAGRSDQAVLDGLDEAFPHWKSGTDIGQAVALANHRLDQIGSGRTAVLIVSDGFDQGSPEMLAAGMRRLHRRAARVLWINPLMHTPGYAPEARGMRSALPYIDHFLAAFDGASLLQAVNRLVRT